MKFNFKLTALFIFTLLNIQINAQNAGNGSWGIYNISTTQTIDDSRAAIEEITYPGGFVSVKLDASQFHGTNWSAGQRVLIIIMAKTGTSPTRNWQIMTITSWNSTTKTLTTNNFPRTNWPSGTLNYANCKMQAIIVPQYTNFTILTGGKLTCSPWDGFTGGVVAFLAQNQLTINNGGWIDVALKGFNNSNTGGFGGIAGVGGNIPLPNSSTLPDFGTNGDGYDYDVRAKGQCLTGPSALSGGDGGTGGVQIKGAWGIPGGDRGTRMNLTKPTPPKMLALGNAGAQGRGGRGGDGGGSGGNGGNGGTLANNAGVVTAGVAGANGGDGGNGGTGGGLIIAIATQISIPHTNNCIDLSASGGANGQNGMTLSNGGEAGNGGDGGDADFVSGNDVGYGGLGAKGQRGNGSGGGNGGGGGSIGSFSIRTITPNTNPLNKTQHVKYINGVGGNGGLGGNYYLTPALDGRNGYVNAFFHPTTNACEKRVYDVYPCAAAEAYQVLGDMDWAFDHGYYIEFRRKDGKGNSKKGAKLAFAMMDTDYYCLYFKCSKLIMAFEPNGTPPVPIFATNPTNGYVGIDYYAVTHNVYWSKLDDTNPVGASCLSIHSTLEMDINASNLSLIPNFGQTGSAIHSVSALTHDFGSVLYGMNTGGGNHKFLYEDLTPLNIFGDGTLNFNIAGSTVNCRKVCTDDTFRFEWVRRSVCEFPNEEGSGGGYPSYGSYIPERSPRLPYIPELWDNPEDGKPGDDGGDGDGDDTYFEGGETTGGGGADDEPETPIYQNLKELTNQGMYAFVAPNPATSELLVRSQKQDFNGMANITITDITGKVVFKQQRILNNDKAETINIQEFSQGIYFIEINAANYREMLKFVKH